MFYLFYLTQSLVATSPLRELARQCVKALGASENNEDVMSALTVTLHVYIAYFGQYTGSKFGYYNPLSAKFQRWEIVPWRASIF